jgi:hypothetical protein
VSQARISHSWILRWSSQEEATTTNPLGTPSRASRAAVGSPAHTGTRRDRHPYQGVGVGTGGSGGAIGKAVSGTAGFPSTSHTSLPHAWMVR